MTHHDLIAVAFALTSALRLFAYAPQIWRVARDRSGAQAISCLTWNLWIAANATTSLYAWTHLHDALLTFVSAGNAACCTCVVLITLTKRSAHARATTAPPPTAQETAMTSTLRPDLTERCTPYSSARTFAVSIAAALVAGLVMLAQSMPLRATADRTTPLAPADPAAKAAPLSAAALDAGVDWARVPPAAEQAGASVAAYDQ